MKLKLLHRIIYLLIAITLFLPCNIEAKTNNEFYSPFVILEKDNNIADLNSCDAILGNVNDDESVAWLIQKILDYLKILGPSLAVVLSSIDFAKAIVSSDEENMKKTQIRFKNRMIAAVLVFFIPFLVEVMLNLLGITANCGIS